MVVPALPSEHVWNVLFDNFWTTQVNQHLVLDYLNIGLNTYSLIFA
jgi:hypothetical protein